MSFQTPLYELAEYLKWTVGGKIQLPDFQRGYKWEDERIRQLLVTVLKGHPMGVVMLLQAGNEQIRFKPRPVEGTSPVEGTEPDHLLLDGQQRLTSLTQALTGQGVVSTTDSRRKLIERRYYVDMAVAVQGEEHLDDAVVSVPGDGVVRANFGKDVVLDLSDPDKERAARHFPVRLLFNPSETMTWFLALGDTELVGRFHQNIVQPASTYNIPAIELDKHTGKSAVATVFEKVNTGGLALNVFELLTATFAGDPDYFAAHGTDFRLREDWNEIRSDLILHPVLADIGDDDFLQAVTLLASKARNGATTARREDVLRLELGEYLTWAPQVRQALIWAAGFLDDQHIHTARDLPYPKQLVPLAVIRVLLGELADVYSVNGLLRQWFWCGVLGELYGAAIESRFARDVDQVPAWATGSGVTPKTVEDAAFVESRLHSMRTRNSAAYKGVYALLMAEGTKDWVYNQPFDKAHVLNLNVDIHHIFPKAWCLKNEIDPEQRESIVNKTPLARKTNIRIGGVAPSAYLPKVANDSGLATDQLAAVLAAHQIDVGALATDDFGAFFVARRGALSDLIQNAMGKPVARDLAAGAMTGGTEDSTAFELEPDDIEDDAAAAADGGDD